MRYNSKGNSIIEVMITIIILTSGLVGAYSILASGQRLADTSENRIKAINIAREGIEAVENMRDTNWIKLSSDYSNCWKTLNYNPNCIGNSAWNGGSEIMSGTFLLLNNGYKWTLSGATFTGTGYGADYKKVFQVYFDASGLITQSETFSASCSSSRSTSCVSPFTREIRLSNPDSDHLKIESIVKWIDSSKQDGPHIVDLEETLSNWKKKL